MSYEALTNYTIFAFIEHIECWEAVWVLSWDDDICANCQTLKNFWT